MHKINNILLGQLLNYSESCKIMCLANSINFNFIEIDQLNIYSLFFLFIFKLYSSISFNIPFFIDYELNGLYLIINYLLLI